MIQLNKNSLQPSIFSMLSYYFNGKTSIIETIKSKQCRNLPLTMIFAIFFSCFVVSTIYSYTGGDASVSYGPGVYTFKLYGAQGGKGHIDGDSEAEGGRGAYVYGKVTIKQQSTFIITVGGQGGSDEARSEGGYPDGGRSGEDDGNSVFDHNDAGGGGGGASRVKIGSTNILVAAGGSGGVGSCRGAPGGDFGKIYYPTGNNAYASTTNLASYGNSNGKGGEGRTHDDYSGSGGGGGYYGGRASGNKADEEDNYWKAVGYGGSSYYNPSYVTDQNSQSGSRSGNGQVELTVDYQCPSHCSTCSSSSTCSECLSGYYLNENSWVSSAPCPSGTIPLNGKCQSCATGYSSCSGSTTTCTACKGGYFLSGNTCTKNST